MDLNKIRELIKENLRPTLTNAKLNILREFELKDKLEELLRQRQQEMIEEGVDPDDWIDDDIYGQTIDYINDMNSIMGLRRKTGGRVKKNKKTKRAKKTKRTKKNRKH